MRESKSIKSYWSYVGYGYEKYIFYHKIVSVLWLLYSVMILKESRYYFIYDNITRPFNVRYKCKLLKKHKFIHQEDYFIPVINTNKVNESYYYCKNCGKTLSENKYIMYLRYKKIKKLRKK